MPTLSVMVVNRKTNKVINDEYPNILLDDSIKKIKEKIFVFNADLIPNLIKIQIKDDSGNFIIINDSNSLLFEHFESIPHEPIVYVSNLQDTISQKQLQSLYIDDSQFKSLFQIFKKEYSDLTEDDLSFIIKLHLMNTGIGNITISDIQDYIKNVQTKRNKLLYVIEQQENDPTLQQFYKLSKNFTPEIEKIFYNDISLVITGENVSYGTKGVFIKLNEIFNILELNDNIPFIALGKKGGSNTKQPQIKIHNRLLDTLPDKEIKNWVLNEKKKLNEATYKMIKGLMIKSKLKNTNNYLTINILPNGIIYVNLKVGDSDTGDLDQILRDIKDNLNTVIDYINQLKSVFLKSKRISPLDKSSIIIDSVDTSIETSIFINRSKFESLIKQEMISKIILELKQTESLDVLSAYYKKFKTHENIEDIKGITINVRDNPYKEDSSIIKIFGANNQTQSTIITWNILILSEMSELIKKNGLFEDFTKKRKIREKTNKKKLKEQGIHFDSRECQAIRQPKLNTENKQPLKKDSYTITFNTQNYRCDTPNYPYPGFTKSNIVCCFKYNQTGNESYIKNVDAESLNILVEPSNFKIKIEQGKNSFETYVIKIVSDYKPGFNENNSMPRYYYLSNTINKLTSENDIVPIHNQALIDVIEQEDNIWLDRVTLSNIIYPSASNKCSFKPDLNNRTSVHSPCDEHKKNKFFGYTSKSVPCCFDKEREVHVSRKKKEADITKQYIIQSSDKTLNYKQLGILPQDISSLLENVLEIKDIHYRMGIIQNNSSFLNAVLLSSNNLIRGQNINNHNEFKQFIVSYLTKNEGEFNKLNNGDISIKYSNIQNFIKYINKTDVFLNWLELIDLLERILKRNIIVLDVTDKTRLLCRPVILNPKKFHRPFMILLKKKNTFEVIIKLLKDDSKKNEVIKDYSYTDKLIKFLTEYYTQTCIRKNVYPDNYSYIPIYPHQLIISKLRAQDTKSSPIGNIKYQVKNDFNKINLLMTKRGVLIPILETGIIDNSEIKIVQFSSLIRQQDKLLTVKDYANVYKVLNKILSNVKDFKPIKLLGIVDSNIDSIGGILTNFNYILPYRKDSKTTSTKFPFLNYKYYLDVDTKLQQIDHQMTMFTSYNNDYNGTLDKLFNLKKLIGDKFNNNQETKEYVEKLIKRPDITKSDKIMELLEIFNTLNIPNDDITLLKAICNEILNDNKERLILNNIITSDTFNKNEVIVRDAESILLNIDDIRKWIKKHQQLV
jgi:hypothetical protein